MQELFFGKKMFFTNIVYFVSNIRRISTEITLHKNFISDADNKAFLCRKDFIA